MNFSDHLNSLIIKLKTQQVDSEATPFYDLMSGAFIWSDEKVHGLGVNEMGCLRAICRYRTSLIVQEVDKRFEFLWNEFKQKYPEWIGFRLERCSPNETLTAQYREIRKKPLY